MLFVDVMLGSGLVRAVRSESFESVPGVVTKSEIRRKRGASFILEYEYAVNGQRYTGTTYHVQPQLVGNGYWYAAHDAHPVGAVVTVHYDPAAPGTAYLRPGVRPDVVLLLLCLTPFNLVMVGFVYAAWWQLTGRRSFDPALVRCVREVPGGCLVRADPNARFLPNAFVVLGASTFAGSFAVGAFTALSDFPPPWWAGISAWAAILVVTVVLASRKTHRTLIHLGEPEGAVAFPADGGRVTVARENLLGINTDTRTRQRNGITSDVFGVSLRWRDEFDQEHTTLLAEYTESADAVVLAEWLSERLRLPIAARVAV